MTSQQIKNIAVDAALLLDELKEMEFNFPDCMTLLTAAMPAIVAVNAKP